MTALPVQSLLKAAKVAAAVLASRIKAAAARPVSTSCLVNRHSIFRRCGRALAKLDAGLSPKPPTGASALNPLTLHRMNDQVVRVLDFQGECVGNLKLIGLVWKFKAVGHDADGQLVPGGGPLTARHNMAFAQLDEAVVSAALLA